MQVDAMRSGNRQAAKKSYLYRNLCSGFIIAIFEMFLNLIRYDDPK